MPWMIWGMSRHDPRTNAGRVGGESALPIIPEKNKTHKPQLFNEPLRALTVKELRTLQSGHQSRLPVVAILKSQQRREISRKMMGFQSSSWHFARNSDTLRREP